MRKSKIRYELDKFTYDPQSDTYTCPAGGQLTLYVRRNEINGIVYRTYRSSEANCTGCKLRSKCLRTAKTRRRQLNIQIEHKGSETLSQQMITKIDRPSSGRIYEKRIGVVEPVFGNIRNCKKLDRFTLRGQMKVDVQWLLFCMVHNVEKLLNYGTFGI